MSIENIKLEETEAKSDSSDVENSQENIELEQAEKEFKDWQYNYWDRRSEGVTFDELESERDNLLENIERKKGKFSFYRDQKVIFDNTAQLSVVKQDRNSSSESLGAYSIYYRLPENKGGLSYIESNQNSNEWHITANMPDSNKELIKEAFERVESVLPKNAVIFEDKTISLDGLRAWSQQLKHGYTLEGNMTSPGLSDIATNKLFADLDFYPPGTKWSEIKFKNQDAVIQAQERLENFLKDNNIDFPVIISSDYSIKILLPKLKKI